MSRIFISGSSTGLGLMAATLLAEQGHQVVLHARSAARADDARRALPQAEAVVTGDLETLAGSHAVAAQVNALGPFDAVIHNAAVGYQEPYRLTEDGLPHVFAVNTLASYLLTALIKRPARLVYLSSGMHHRVHAHLDELLWQQRRWDAANAYAESKLHDAMLAFAVARRWPQVFSNALEPGWVATRMGGSSVPDDLQQAHLTQAWLASGEDPAVRMSGRYFRYLQPMAANPQAHDEALQDALLERL
ncbi:MAG: 5-keto-D-gluconate 5-reductase [Stenotrophomonas maltophilia]|uniref:5-keto-D-gluconate 5-reductase n=1 Tax=Stenotrophomonas maltophilia TaxID=40324 RepID=A0A7V8FJ22_STEMA|nr:MAG: 5-keto-D-gluconate 5-reductase [Stenotrophomonas maltophilia]